MTEAEREAGLLDAFAQLADTLVADYDVLDLLQVLVERCAALLDIEAAGVLLALPESDDLELVASSSEAGRIVEAIELSVAAGPCIDAYRESRVVSVPSIDELPDQYRAFRDVAVRQSFHAVHSVPMRLRATTIGALNLFSGSTGELGASDARAAQALADIATIGILQERTLRAADVMQAQLQHALDSRVVIEQAKGMLAYTHGVSVGEAFERLRGYARAQRISIAVAARGLVDRRLIF